MTNPAMIDKDPQDDYGVLVTYPESLGLLPPGKTIDSATLTALDGEREDATNVILADTEAVTTDDSVQINFKPGGNVGEVYTVKINITLSPSGTMSDTLKVKMRSF
jgi:hypothetical protein